MEIHFVCWHEQETDVPEQWSYEVGALADINSLPWWLQANLGAGGPALWAHHMGQVLREDLRLATTAIWRLFVKAVSSRRDLRASFWWSLQITRRTAELGLPLSVKPTWDEAAQRFRPKLKWQVNGLQPARAYRRPTQAQQRAGFLTRPLLAAQGVAPRHRTRRRQQWQ